MVSLEPTIVTVPVFRTDVFTATYRAVASTLTTLATKTAVATVTSTAIVAVADSSAAFPTSTGIPPLPAAFDSPLATGKNHTPVVAVVTLVAVIVCALILLIALCYFIFLRLRGKCPQCPVYENELKKYKNRGSLNRNSGTTGQVSMQDLEKGLSPMDEQAHQHKVRMRAQSLARLENRAQDQVREDRTTGDRALERLRNSRNQARKDRTAGGWALERLHNSQTKGVEMQRDSGWSGRASSDEKEEPKIFEKEQEQVNEYVPGQVAVQEPTPAHLVAPVGYDEEATLVDPALRNPEFDKTHDDYLRDVVAPREKERQAEQAAAWLDIASDPNTRESVKVRAVVKANAQMIEMDTIKEENVDTAAVT